MLRQKSDDKKLFSFLNLSELNSRTFILSEKIFCVCAVIAGRQQANTISERSERNLLKCYMEITLAGDSSGLSSLALFCRSASFK